MDDVNYEINEVSSRIIGDLDTGAEIIKNCVLLEYGINLDEYHVVQDKNIIKQEMDLEMDEKRYEQVAIHENQQNKNSYSRNIYPRETIR